VEEGVEGEVGGSGERSSGRRGRRSDGGSIGGWLLNNGGSCLIRWRLISRIERREGVRVREGSWGFCSQKDLGREQRVQSRDKRRPGYRGSPSTFQCDHRS
jgi:hypothetical protein